MAVALDQALGTGHNTGASTCSMTTTAAVAAGAHVIVVLGWFKNDATASTFTTTGGLTWTKDAELKSGSIHIAIWRASAPSGLASSTTLGVTIGAASDSLMGAGSFTGIDTSGTVITSGTNNGTGTGWGSGTIASTSGNAVIGGSFCDGLTGSSSPTSPGVELFDFNNAGQNETETSVYKLSVSGSDSVDGTWSSSVSWIAGAVCYKAAAGAAATSDIPLRRSDAVLLMR
jgi:hypothetical protein